MSRWIVGAWVVLMLGTHYGVDVIATLYTSQVAAAKAWGYVGQQFEAMAAFLTVIVLATRARELVVVCLWGFIERSENAVCRMAFPMDRPPPKTAPTEGLCDVATGFPVYMFSLWVLLLAVIFWYRKTGSTTAWQT